MVDVFISYSRTDKERVARLARAIEAEGYKVWWDAELPPHQSYGEVITAKIESANAALVVWSPDAAASEWVRAEADAARNQKKLIQTSLGDIMPPLPFNQIQCANIGDWDGSPDHPGWRKVKESLAALCGEREEMAEPAVAAAAAASGAAPLADEAAPAAPVHFASQPAPAPRSSKIPMLAGGGIAAVGLTAAAWMTFGGSKQAEQGEMLPETPFEETGVPGYDGTEVADGGGFPEPGGFELPVGKPDEAAYPIADDLNREISIVNATGQTIMYLYWSNTQAQEWGIDRLGNEVFPQGGQWQVIVDDGTGACNFDFMARLADEREIVRSNIDVCAIWELSFN